MPLSLPPWDGARKDEALSGLVDADWAGDKVRRAPISGFMWLYGGGLISWSAKKQNCVALSSTKAEYISLTQAVQEGIWLWNSLGQIGTSYPMPLVISTNNNGALSLASNDSLHRKVKHINICYHFIWSHIEHGEFNVIHTPGIINIADLFTKSLACIKFQEHVMRLGLGTHWGVCWDIIMWCSSSAHVDSHFSSFFTYLLVSSLHFFHYYRSGLFIYEWTNRGRSLFFFT